MKKTLLRTALTRDEFDRRIAPLERRLRHLRDARSDAAPLRRVVVRGHFVRRHWVEEHERFVSRRRA